MPQPAPPALGDRRGGMGAEPPPIRPNAFAVGRRRKDCEDRFRSLMVVGCGLVTAGVTPGSDWLYALGATCPLAVAGPGPVGGAGLIRSLTTRR